jgi:Cu+-exporting ATPase
MKDKNSMIKDGSLPPMTVDQQYTCPMHPEVIQDHPGTCPKCGMALEPIIDLAEETPNAELAYMSKRFWISIFLTIPLLFISMGEHIPGITHLLNFIPSDLSGWVQLILATPVILWCGWPLLKRGWNSLIERHLNMFTLIALGIGIAYVYSVIGLLFPNFFPAAFRNSHGGVNLYFEVAATITTLVLVGQVLELRGRQQTGGAIRALLNLAPKMARKINKDGTDETIPLNNVKVGDHLQIRPGEKIPVDGKIIEGHSTIDESMITGESIPVEKEKNDSAIGGTINLSGSFIMQAEHVGSKTILGQIVQQVAQAQRSKAPIQRLADLISGYFVPIVIMIALITFFAWILMIHQPLYGLISAIGVLIIACPCALGLATPLSIMVGMGRGAQTGILIKNAASLELFEKVNTLVIDKTGTLTVGKPSVNKIITLSGFSESEILSLAASLEYQSEHPLAGAIINAAKAGNVTLKKTNDFVAEIGKGVKGIIDGKEVALGNIKLLTSLNLDHAIQTDIAEELRREGETVMFLVVDNQIAGLISVSDPIKPTTQMALDKLREEGMRIVMVTGDNRTTAEAIGKKLGIDLIEAEVLPQQKAQIVKNLRNQGYIVAMAGDGINDASALASADIGIAMGTGTDIAMQSAAITLVKGDLLGIVRARQLSKKVMRNIRENLFLAFFYNTISIPIAAGVLYPFTGLLLNPIIAAAAMSLSSISVIGNALRLRRISFK